MLVKSKVKYIQSLSHKKQRDELGVFVAEGPKIINDLLSAKLDLLDVFAVTTQVAKLALDPSRITLVDEPTMQKISSLATPVGALAVFRKPALPPLHFENRITIALDDIQDPGNLGTIVRSADWFGVTQIICSPACADAFSAKAVQSTMGSIGRVNLYYGDLLPMLARKNSVSVYAATLDGKNVFDFALLGEGILVIGNESKGVSPELLAHIPDRVTIPGRGGAESLNAAVAAGILLAHLTR